ncbi:MAG: GrpB family protein [Bacilli bacterium]|jgi:GrpB-like predicted nucleotidyltransferase (UPF0157 family)|nr:GrpB family protein [Bacilli bacterium]
MTKRLSEMSLEELWELFPIFLTEHNEEWVKDYEQEANHLRNELVGRKVHINHIGSTAVKSIWAKPIIDILVEVPQNTNLHLCKKIIIKLGYRCMHETKTRISFNKGYTKSGFADKVFHLHLRHENDNDELYFRDYLNEDEDIAKEYETFKLDLWKKFEHDRDGYTNAKTDFISKCSLKAKQKYKNRYKR